jgi:S-adenosylmethionine:tRNA ribosyltransferase-isomerase
MTDLNLFDYKLPASLIAATPAERRDESCLLCLDRRTGRIEHRRFSDVRRILKPGDVLVINDARVMPARLTAVRATGGKVDVLLVRQVAGETTACPTWSAMLESGGRLKAGEILAIPNTDVRLRLVQKSPDGQWMVNIEGNTTVECLFAHGRMPLPPYVVKARKARGLPESMPELDAERYQTVFARADGAVAAPTAGLHFTKQLLKEIEAEGVLIRPLTLLIGPGTFRPVKCQRIEEHSLDAECYRLPAATADAVSAALREGRRVVATGTTCCRVLEHVARTGDWREQSGWTDLYIYPPFEFKAVGALITNFHLPRSTLLMLVCAFAGRERVLEAYEEAVRAKYRFYSYGDAMFIS